MIKKFCMLFATMLTSVVAMAQLSEDSMVTIVDGMRIPLVEKRFVTPTHFQDNWYVGVYGGAISNWGSDASNVGFFKKTGPAGAITVGKQITPVSDLRLQIGYSRNTGVTDDLFGKDFGKPEYDHNTFKFNSWALNIDYLPNFTNMFLGFREDRLFYFKGLLGVGGCIASGYQTGKYAEFFDNQHSQQLVNQDKYDTRRHSLINLRAGLVGSFLLSRFWNVHVELVENFVDNSYDSNPTTDNTWDGHLDLLVGLTYHFKGKGGKAGGFYYARHDVEFYKKRLSLIDDLRNKTKQRIAEVEEMPADTIVFDAHVTYTLIAFDEGSDVIDRLQQTNIYTTAFTWMKEPKSDIYITNSEAEDNSLYRKRAEAVRDALVERYEVPAHKIKFVADEKAIRPRGNYIVFIVND